MNRYDYDLFDPIGRNSVPSSRKSGKFREGILPHAVETVFETLLVFFDLVIGFLTSPSVRMTLRVCGATLCFFAFLFVIGAVEAGSLGFGAGVLSILFLFGITFFCLYTPGKKKG